MIKGLFKKKTSEAEALLEKHENKELNDTEFMKAFGNVEVYYSTQFISIVETNAKNNKSNTPVKLGVIIDPIKYKITLDVPKIEPVIRLIRG